jgi:NAD(P)-dependent dehydrogenase (short-subunit alcohol dehydrogenase family)
MTSAASTGAISPDLAGKTVLVTGGIGIGEAIVRRFAAQGAKTAFIDSQTRWPANWRSSAIGFISSRPTSLTLRPCVRRTSGSAGCLAASRSLVNNAARDPRHATLEVAPHYWDERIAVTQDGEAELMKGECLKRLLMPDELAWATLFCASDEASACTSQQYVIDGGWV